MRGITDSLAVIDKMEIIARLEEIPDGVRNRCRIIVEAMILVVKSWYRQSMENR